MAQLGSGAGSAYPNAIDTRQAFVNVPVPAPDSASRLDAELANDTLAAVVQIQTALGANPQGTYGSVAARLHQFLPGGGVTPLFFSFAAQTTVLIKGTEHRLGTPTPLIQIYDAGTPRAALQAQQITVDQLTYDVTLQFATPQSGFVAMANPAPLYISTFTAQTSVTVAGTTHQLGTGRLLVSVYTSSGFTNYVTPAVVSIRQDNFNVTVNFGTAQSGSILLSAAGPRYVHTQGTAVTSWTIPGATHGLGTAALLYQIYDAGNPVSALIEAGSVHVDISNYTVTVVFATPQAGVMLLVRSTEITGTDFEMRDGGVTDSTATRVFSEGGTLRLQMGGGNAIAMEDKTGTPRAILTNDGKFGIGTIAPTHQLHVATDSAAKPGSNTWATPSDERLKEVLGSFEDGLAVVEGLHPVRYKYNGLGGMPRDGREYVGVLAQAVQAIAPYMVTSIPGQLTPGGEATDILTYDGHALAWVLVNAIKELTTRVAHLEAALQAKEDPSDGSSA